MARRLSFSLDASGRVSTTTTSTGTTVTGQTRNHYDGSDDSPAWTETRTDPGAAWDGWTRYVTGLAGGLGLTVTNTGVVELQLANPHGDIVATTTLGTTGLAGYTETDEYGQPDNPAMSKPRYGWLGSYQRDTGTTLAGLTLKGARLYNPTTGRFLSIDPVPGGNDNPYTYPADPINQYDLDGNCGCRRRGDGGGGYLGNSLERMPYGFPPGLDLRSPSGVREGIYVVRTANNKIYVGQSFNVGKRLKQHVMSGKVTAEDARRALRISIKGGKTRREVAEQRMKDILELEVKAQGGSLANKINPIGKKRQHLLTSTGRNRMGL